MLGTILKQYPGASTEEVARRAGLTPIEAARKLRAMERRGEATSTRRIIGTFQFIEWVAA